MTKKRRTFIALSALVMAATVGWAAAASQTAAPRKIGRAHV
jgi:hypothetical protein